MAETFAPYLPLFLSVSVIPHWTHESDLKGSNIDGWPRLGEGRLAKVSELAMPSKAMVLQFELLNKVVKWMRSPSACRHFAKEVGPTVDVGH